MTLLQKARRGSITAEMRGVAREEGIEVERLRQSIAAGRVVITKNVARKRCRPVGIGDGLRTKINANLGTSSEFCDLKYEVEKAKVAMKYGADTVMDLSTAGDIDRVRRLILKEVPIPVGTVPIYQAAIDAVRKHHVLVHMTADGILQVIEKQAKDGVDFMTIHAGITLTAVECLKRNSRITGIVSRGGVFLASWMLHHKAENPIYKNFDYILEIAKRYDFCISLGDALRPGCIADSSDWFQMQELLTVSGLVERCWKAGVQVMVEGPGHVPLDQVEANVVLEKSICKGAPFYVLGPLVTDVGAGYDHLVGAIGGAIAAKAGADFLCYVTPSEHLGLPTIEDVREGVVASKIAAHSADIVKLGKKALRQDLQMALARAKLDWKSQHRLSLNPEKASEIRSKFTPSTEACSMCGDYCVFKILPVKRRNLKGCL